MLDKENCKVIDYKLIRKNRKTVSIKVTDKGEVIVNSPLWLSDEKIKQIIADKTDWITSKLEAIKALNESNSLKYERLMFLGQEYKLNIYESANSVVKVIFDKKEFKVFIPKSIQDDREKYMVDALDKWYRIQARTILETRTSYYAEKLNVTPKRIAIKDQSTKWGSCSSKGNINYNYRIIMAPINIIDYLVVHELCHLVELNHSSEFWKLVEDVLPNYKESINWLKLNGANLKIYSRL